MVEQPICAYKLSEFRVVPVGTEMALVTYLADIQTPDNAVHHMVVGELWTKRNDLWLIRAYSGTLMPISYVPPIALQCLSSPKTGLPNPTQTDRLLNRTDTGSSGGTDEH